MASSCLVDADHPALCHRHFDEDDATHHEVAHRCTESGPEIGSLTRGHPAFRFLTEGHALGGDAYTHILDAGPVPFRLGGRQCGGFHQPTARSTVRWMPTAAEAQVSQATKTTSSSSGTGHASVAI